ncbi:hypothetical protein [Lentzea atacamensis]|uniref:hypothetical protein n=1 Tax=Lentzea atacamensis TaxID=531938 RepID=UPI000DD3B045|nr:hypothetical protein [Lentzea atacamensis]
MPEILEDLAKLVSAGEIPAARKLGRTLIKTADINHLWLIRRVADVLEEKRPRTAVAFLRQMWQETPDPIARAIITACVPKDGETRHRPEPTRRRNDYQPPQPVTRRRDAMAKRARSRQQQADAADFARYRDDSAGVADGEQLMDRDDRRKAEEVYASGIDYDRAALYRTGLEFRCLTCNIERDKYDLDADRMKAGHGDDGLCQECREKGCTGIPELPAGHSAADAVYARCSFIWERAVTPSAARVFLQGEWKRAVTPAVRAAIADYARAHLPQETPAEAPAALGECAGCPAQREPKDVRHVAVDDGLCAECRACLAELEAEEAAAKDNADATAHQTDEQAETARPEYRQHRAPSKRAAKRAKGRRAAELEARKKATKAQRDAARAAKRSR